MRSRTVAAVDLGAESGRVMLARFDGRAVALEEVHRFPNRPVWMRGHLFWDVLELWREVLAGLRRAKASAGTLASVGVDTWGVDYALVDKLGQLVGQPTHYRDQRTAGMLEQLESSIGRQAIYTTTGIQFMPINTLYQLAAHARQQPTQLHAAHHLLLMPDLLHCWLSGEQVAEYTNATTTQLVDAKGSKWAPALVAAVFQRACCRPLCSPEPSWGRCFLNSQSTWEIGCRWPCQRHMIQVQRWLVSPLPGRIIGRISVRERGHWLGWNWLAR
jgi:rhamnulokinase